MSICPLAEDRRCHHCGVGLIGKIVSYDLKSYDNYLEGLIVIITYVCLRCQVTIHQEIREFTF